MGALNGADATWVLEFATVTLSDVVMTNDGGFRDVAAQPVLAFTVGLAPVRKKAF